MDSSPLSFRLTFALSLVCAVTRAAPAPSPVTPPSLGPTLGVLGDVSLPSVLAGIAEDVDDLEVAATAFASVLAAATPTFSPTDIPQAASALDRIFGPYATGNVVPDFLDTSLELILNGLSVQDFTKNVIDDTIPSEPANSFNNTNPVGPRQVLWPYADARDAPYSLPERALRAAIRIPETFTYGKSNVVPMILVPGTGTFGGANFGSNMIKLFQDGKIADIVWLNIPGAQLDDIQDNAEYVAYAIGYIASVTGRKPAVATWSQGSIDTAWALQYWPSTRQKVSDLINYSPDYYGTVLAYILAPGFPDIPSTPAVIQQERNGSFIKTLRDGGGASAYVPTTTIYSALFDEIVEPQQGMAASAYLLDDRKVGVTNNEIQTVCLGQPGGVLYTHEGVLYSPLAYALTVDALTHQGPGRPERLDLDKVCSSYATEGLSLTDILATEANIPIAAYNIFLYPHKTRDAPEIRSYARRG